MRDRLEDLLKWTRRYQLRDRPETLIEAVTEKTMRRGRIVLGTPLFLCSDLDKTFFGECTGSAFEIWRASTYSFDRYRMPKMKADLRWKDGCWELEAKIVFKHIRIETLFYFGLGALGLIALLILYNSTALTGPTPWLLLGMPLLALLIFLGMENARMEQETEALIAFFEKLVAPYAVAADTMDRDADARDP